MEFRRHTLPNGLEVVAECNPAAYSTAVGFFVKTGSRDESDQIAGVSHFLEHMAFKGTAKRTADDVNRHFDEMGAHYNAFTNEEATVYYAAVLPEKQEAAVELLSDILRPALRRDDFDTEKQVILEEIHMYEDQPPFGADDKCKAAYYGPHPLGRSVLGTAESISRLSVEAMREYFQSRYGAANIALVGAGQIDFATLVDSAQRFCGHWEPARAQRIVESPDPRQGFQVIHKPAATQQYAVWMAAGPSATDPDRYAAKVLAAILGDDTGSRLFWELVDPGLAEHAGLHHYEYDGAGLMVTTLSCEPEQVEGNLQRILDVYRAAQRHGVTDGELAQAKHKVGSRVVLASERPRNRLFTVGSDWVQRHTYRSVRDDLDAVAAISLDEVDQVLQRWPPSHGMTVTIGPRDQVKPPA
ncbi:MAG TPA: insulinase family protein [Planctomycetes bacterium]|nr:insulinase family protein [Planctomycetota bacterium]